MDAVLHTPCAIHLPNYVLSPLPGRGRLKKIGLDRGSLLNGNSFSGKTAACVPHRAFTGDVCAFKGGGKAVGPNFGEPLLKALAAHLCSGL